MSTTARTWVEASAIVSSRRSRESTPANNRGSAASDEAAVGANGSNWEIIVIIVVTWPAPAVSALPPFAWAVLADVAEVVGGVVADDALAGEGWELFGVEGGVGSPLPVDAVEGVGALVTAGQLVVDEDRGGGLDLAVVLGLGNGGWEGGAVVGEGWLADGGNGGGCGSSGLLGAGSSWTGVGGGGNLLGRGDGDGSGGGWGADYLGGGGSGGGGAAAPSAWWVGWHWPAGVVARGGRTVVTAVVALGVTASLGAPRWNWSWGRGWVDGEEWVEGDWGVGLDNGLDGTSLGDGSGDNSSSSGDSSGGDLLVDTLIRGSSNVSWGRAWGSLSTLEVTSASLVSPDHSNTLLNIVTLA